MNILEAATVAAGLQFIFPVLEECEQKTSVGTWEFVN
jgi:hypothetical protein